MTVRKFLDISTGHLTQETRDKLDHGEITSTYYPMTYGWFVWVPDEPMLPENEPERWPDDLRECILYARSQGCDYIMFDGDAEYCDELRAYDDNGDVRDLEREAADAFSADIAEEAARQ
jgi:hypothetical protein